MDAHGIVSRLGQGYLIDDLAEALATVAAEVVATGKDGQVTVTLKVSTRQAGDEMVAISDTISRKPPARAPRGAFMFALDGELYHQDPRQTQLPFRAVSGDQEIREQAGGTPAVREA